MISPAVWNHLRAALHWVGIGLALISLIFVAYALFAVNWAAVGKISNGRVAVTVAFCALIYAIANLTLGLAWVKNLQALQSGDLPRTVLCSQHFVTQLYKYIPTNVLHFAGRHAMAKRLGLRNSALVGAAAIEVIGLVLAAVIIILVAGGPFFLGQAAHLLGLDPLYIAFSIGVVFLLVASVALTAAWHARTHQAEKIRLVPLVFSFALYIVFFLLSGAMLTVLAHWLLNLNALDPAWLVLVGATGWILGFVVPGAPAGIGVREAVTIAMLQHSVPVGDATVMAALFRVATISGDGIAAVVGLALGNMYRYRDRTLQPKQPG